MLGWVAPTAPWCGSREQAQRRDPAHPTSPERGGRRIGPRWGTQGRDYTLGPQVLGWEIIRKSPRQLLTQDFHSFTDREIEAQKS